MSISQFSRESSLDWNITYRCLTLKDPNAFFRPYVNAQQVKKGWTLPWTYFKNTVFDTLKFIAQAGEFIFSLVSSRENSRELLDGLVYRLGSLVCNALNTLAALFFAASRTLSTLVNGGYQTTFEAMNSTLSDAGRYFSNTCNSMF